MKLLITGGSGFIGKNLIELLGGKYDILAPTHAELELLDENAVSKYLNNNTIDVVIHSAVRPGHRNSKDFSSQLNINLRMFFNLVRNKDKYSKMIFLSSGLVYDQRYYLPKMKEKYFDVHLPEDEGGFSKYIISKYIENKNNIIELRPFGVFGKYEDYSIRFISNMICKAVFDLPLTMKQNKIFDYICVDDLADIIEYFIRNNGKHKAYNVTPDKSIELVELAKIVLAISGQKLPIQIAAEGMGLEYSGDNARLHDEIKNLKLTPIDAAIEKLYKWYANNKNIIKKENLLIDK